MRLLPSCSLVPRSTGDALVMTVCVALSLWTADAAAQAPQGGSAPAASRPATYATEAALKGALKAASGNPTDMQTASVQNTEQYRINLVHRTRPAGAIAHTVGTEVHHITEGSGMLVTGGTIVKGATANAATIQGGVSRRVSKGDVILIPENTPHWYSEIDGQITYLEVRFNVPAPKE
jgi:mannose-6-phosphate isomerase-like protein (cupin superfamily)